MISTPNPRAAALLCPPSPNDSPPLSSFATRSHSSRLSPKRSSVSAKFLHSIPSRTPFSSPLARRYLQPQSSTRQQSALGTSGATIRRSSLACVQMQEVCGPWQAFATRRRRQGRRRRPRNRSCSPGPALGPGPRRMRAEARARAADHSKRTGQQQLSIREAFALQGEAATHQSLGRWWLPGPPWRAGIPLWGRVPRPPLRGGCSTPGASSWRGGGGGGRGRGSRRRGAPSSRGSGLLCLRRGAVGRRFLA